MVSLSTGGASEPRGAIRARQTGHHVQRAEVGGYRREVAAVDVLDDRTLFSTRRLYLFDRYLAPIGPGSRGAIASFAHIRGASFHGLSARI